MSHRHQILPLPKSSKIPCYYFQIHKEYTSLYDTELSLQVTYPNSQQKPHLQNLLENGREHVESSHPLCNRTKLLQNVTYIKIYKFIYNMFKMIKKAKLLALEVNFVDVTISVYSSHILIIQSGFVLKWPAR